MKFLFFVALFACYSRFWSQIYEILLGSYVDAQRRGCDTTLLSACQNDFQALTGIDLRGYWREVKSQVEDSYAGKNDTNFRKVCRYYILLLIYGSQN